MLYQLSYLATSVAGIDVRQAVHYTIAPGHPRTSALSGPSADHSFKQSRLPDGPGKGRSPQHDKDGVRARTRLQPHASVFDRAAVETDRLHAAVHPFRIFHRDPVFGVLQSK